MKNKIMQQKEKKFVPIATSDEFVKVCQGSALKFSLIKYGEQVHPNLLVEFLLKMVLAELLERNLITITSKGLEKKGVKNNAKKKTTSRGTGNAKR